MHIREFDRKDYPAISAVHNAIYPQRPRKSEAWAHSDESRDPKCMHQRWVAVDEDHILGTGAYDQDITDYAPGRFYVDFKVAPDHQGRGIGTALYTRVMEALAPLEPRVLRANAYADQPQGLAFMQRRGFYEAWRETPVRLEVEAVDLEPYQDLEDELHRDGFRIVTLQELEGDPDRDHKLYALYMAIERTLPREEITDVKPMSFEEWHGVTFTEQVSLDGYFVATRGRSYIGLKEIGIDPSTQMLWAGLMGVLPEYRRRGIGMAMQVRAIAYARAHGFTTLTSSTGAVNQAMQHIFDSLGYLRLPVWHQLQKDLRVPV